jgi:redox-sensitive bicupin YhaK (pirin superfamily)
MMITLRKSHERGLGDHGWLKSRHTFSFANYYDPQQMGFSALRVINEDRIAGGTGFGEHPHRDMEIISYVISGGLKHQDSMGNKTVIRPGEIQRMSAGTGIVHAEQNEFKDQETHFFQIWVMPEKNGIQPGYGQKSFEEQLKQKNLLLVMSQNGRDGSITVNQDADLYISRTKKDEMVPFEIRKGRNLWIQVVKGKLNVNGTMAEVGDGLAITQEAMIHLKSLEDSEALLFDLPPSKEFI